MIPRVIHRLWIGGKEPSATAPFALTWNQPGWKVVNWDDSSVAGLFPLRNQSLYDSAEELAPHHSGQLRADVVRYEILHRFGGVYVDTDFECLKAIDPLLPGVSCFAAWENDTFINNAILGSTKGHSFIESLVSNLPESVALKSGKRPAQMSGPHHVTRTYLDYSEDDVTVFPQELFYPYGHAETAKFGPGDKFNGAYAVHHWRNKRRELGKSVKLSVAIMAHPKRQHFVDELLPKLPSASLVMDTKNDRWDTGRRSLLSYDPNATHHVVVQDDAILCRDFLPAVEQACAAADQHPIALYTGVGNYHRREVASAVERAQEARTSWIAGEGPWWGVAVAIPVGHIDHLVEWCDTQYRVENYDLRMSRYYAHRGTDCWYTVPSLVDHRTVAENPSLVEGRTADRFAKVFCTGSALDIDWWKPPVAMIGGRLNLRKEDKVARKAIRDTYGIERIGDVEVRRKVKAGRNVPAHYEVPDGTFETVADQPSALASAFGSRLSSPSPTVTQLIQGPDTVQESPAFSSMTIPDLKREAASRGIEVPFSARKQEIIDLLEDDQV